jgi:hypothetical protein
MVVLATLIPNQFPKSNYQAKLSEFQSFPHQPNQHNTKKLSTQNKKNTSLSFQAILIFVIFLFHDKLQGWQWENSIY